MKFGWNVTYKTHWSNLSSLPPVRINTSTAQSYFDMNLCKAFCQSWIFTLCSSSIAEGLASLASFAYFLRIMANITLTSKSLPYVLNIFSSMMEVSFSNSPFAPALHALPDLTPIAFQLSSKSMSSSGPAHISARMSRCKAALGVLDALDTA